MRKKKEPGGASPGEFDDLLREIEKEPVPDRLLELALKLQSALVSQREAQEAAERMKKRARPLAKRRLAN